MDTGRMDPSSEQIEDVRGMPLPPLPSPAALWLEQHGSALGLALAAFGASLMVSVILLGRAEDRLWRAIDKAEARRKGG